MAVIVIAVAGYFYWREFVSNEKDFLWAFSDIDYYLLTLSLVLFLFSYVVDCFMWKYLLADEGSRAKISFVDIFYIVFTSGLFRYIPGRIWTYLAQFSLFCKFGVSKTKVFYINAVSIIQTVFLSFYLLVVFSFHYLEMPIGMALPFAALLFFVNLIFIYFGSHVVNNFFFLVGKLSRLEFQPINTTPKIMAAVQVIFLGSWFLAGIAVYLLANGLGLSVSPVDTVAVVASMCISWVAGSLAVLVPAGLGVREGVMLLMLKPVLTVEAALILPVATRLLMLLAEGILGTVALYIGVRRNALMSRKAGP